MNLLFILLLSLPQYHNITMRWNGGHGSLIDSVQIAGKMYYQGSVLKLPTGITSDVVCYVTYDNNSSGETELQLYMKNQVVSDRIQFRRSPRAQGSRVTKGTFRSVRLDNLESIVLIDN